MNVQYFDSLESMTETAARIFQEIVNAAVASRDVAYVALSGGHTPRPLYERLAEPPYVGDIPWQRLHIFLGDERVVPPDSTSSNFHMVKEALLDRAPIPTANVHHVPTEMGPEGAAAAYDSELREMANQQGEAVPRFDLMLLGIGPDGHTASLFPRTDVLNDTTHFACAVHLPPDSVGAKDAPDRVTMTYPVINASRHIVFLASGDKAEPLLRIEAGDPALPATHVKPVNGDVRWLVVEPEKQA
jgi:6-phosphogluconolactonase